jgi:hypothetical protein
MSQQIILPKNRQSPWMRLRVSKLDGSGAKLSKPNIEPRTIYVYKYYTKEPVRSRLRVLRVLR